MRTLQALSYFLLFSALVVIFGGCASDPETRQLLRQIKTVAINKNVDLGGTELSAGSGSDSLEALLVNEFAGAVDRARLFPGRVAITSGSLQTWNDEVSEMSYDAQFKIRLRPGTTPSQFRVEAILQSRYGVIVWRSSKVANRPSGTNDRAWMTAACNALIHDLQRARR